jgi:hypothetical protein
MPNIEKTAYRVKDKGGPKDGQEISFEAPAFELSEFLKTPNADEFIEKAYRSAAKKIAREIEEKKNGSLPADLSSYEMIVARCLKFTKGDVIRWLGERDWSRISHFTNPEALRTSMEKWLPSLASRVNSLPQQPSKTVAVRVVAALADKPDPVADYLFVMLTVERPQAFYDVLLSDAK